MSTAAVAAVKPPPLSQRYAAHRDPRPSVAYGSTVMILTNLYAWNAVDITEMKNKDAEKYHGVSRAQLYCVTTLKK